jgi:hypothetical protein
MFYNFNRLKCRRSDVYVTLDIQTKVLKKLINTGGLCQKISLGNLEDSIKRHSGMLYFGIYLCSQSIDLGRASRLRSIGWFVLHT